MQETKLLYGKPIAERINQQSKASIDDLKNNNKKIPKIKVICLGNQEASMSYMAGFIRTCGEIGIQQEWLSLPENTTDQELIKSIHELNEDERVNGILLQMPLPSHIDVDRITHEISPDKDLDGFHPENIGKLQLNQPTLAPCTALSVMAFIEASQIELAGKKVVVIGRSNVVGKPVAWMCLAKNATVTVCHSKTKNIETEAKQADVLIAAIGKAKMINRNWIKKGAIVIDVGVNRDENNKLCGDVDLEDVIDLVDKISPVPKGVGVVTNAMLIANAIKAYQKGA